jgi:IS1 family transposase
VFVSIFGRQMYLWRAVDDEGEVLDILVQSRRDKNAALRLMRKLLKRQGLLPASIVTDRYRAYDAALRNLGLSQIHRRGKWLNNRAESSHVPMRRRERKTQGFRSVGSAQRFLSSHSAVYNTFNICRHLTTGTMDPAKPQATQRHRKIGRAVLVRLAGRSLFAPIRWRPRADSGQKQDTGDLRDRYFLDWLVAGQVIKVSPGLMPHLVV